MFDELFCTREHGISVIPTDGKDWHHGIIFTYDKHNYKYRIVNTYYNGIRL